MKIKLYLRLNQNIIKKEILIKDNSSIEILKAYKNLENLIKNNKCDQSVEKYTHLFWNYYSKYINEKII